MRNSQNLYKLKTEIILLIKILSLYYHICKFMHIYINYTFTSINFNLSEFSISSLVNNLVLIKVQYSHQNILAHQWWENIKALQNVFSKQNSLPILELDVTKALPSNLTSVFYFKIKIEKKAFKSVSPRKTIIRIPGSGLRCILHLISAWQ